MLVRPPGLVALVGSGEFLPNMASLDRSLLDHLTDPPRVAIVPTASAPDGDPVFERWLRMGVDHFTGLGARALPIALRTRSDAEDSRIAAQIAACNVVYLSGGKPSYLRDALKDSVCWQAISEVFDNGGVIAGCSAGAMVLGERMIDFPRVWPLVSGLGLAPGIAIVPHFDEFGMHLLARIEGHVTREVTIVGVDGSTALVGVENNWRVVGRGSVTVIDGRDSLRYTDGQDVPLPGSTSVNR